MLILFVASQLRGIYILPYACSHNIIRLVLALMLTLCSFHANKAHWKCSIADTVYFNIFYIYTSRFCRYFVSIFALIFIYFSWIFHYNFQLLIHCFFLHQAILTFVIIYLLLKKFKCTYDCEFCFSSLYKNFFVTTCVLINILFNVL